ncbi:MAG: sigma-70 family RNA polymerase sigma factor [Flavobacteriaceae bacterium]|nr:sigma-70 family RNA polymerase sigma factor [Flavobacteriaceae bacterium]
MHIKQLINRCKNQNLKAQKELYDGFAPVLYGICLKYSRNKHEAEDNLHDTFITIFEKINQFKFKGSFEGWIKRICLNTCLTRYRNQKVFELINEDQLKEVVSFESKFSTISLQYLLKCIQELPDRYRLVFNLYVLDGHSHQEIADMLSISVGTSKSNLSRARAILKPKVESYIQQKKVSNG